MPLSVLNKPVNNDIDSTLAFNLVDFLARAVVL
jgi:hypothetical protein